MANWDVHPVFFVGDVENSIRFYVDQLGFTETNRCAEDGKLLVGGVERDGCVLLFTRQWPENNGRSRLWIQLNLETYRAFRADLEVKGVALKEGFWGFDTVIVEDPDGNELFFPVPKPEADGA